MDNDLLTAAEVATILRCHTRTLERYRNRRENPLKAEQHSRKRYLYRRGDVERFRDNARGDSPY